jgi:beta-phosphoglucomutase family hydrolase
MTMSDHRGVIWDMDGVLVDTVELHFQTWAETLARRGVSFTRVDFEANFGMKNTAMLEHLLGRTISPEMADAISDDKERLFRDLIRGRAQALPGVREWLTRLETENARQAVASSAPQANIDALLGELGLRPHFAAIVSGQTLPAKPDPAVYLRAAQLIEVPPERCVVIEDAVVGVEGAKSAGMACIAVTTTHSAEALQAADVVVERLDALPADTFERLLGS